MASIATPLERQIALQQGVKRTVFKTLIALLCSVAFTIALVPLYDVFCEITGLNGKTASTPQVMRLQEVDAARTIKVQLITRNTPGLPWRLEVIDKDVTVNPGEIAQIRYRFTNTSNELTTGKAVPSLSPSAGATFFHKMECFCFEQQWLEGGESIELPLVFQVDKKLPKEITTLTLAYTLFPMDAEVGFGGVNE